MKTRKILAFILAMAMLTVSMAVVASAEDGTSPYSIVTSQTKTDYTDVESFDPAGLVITDGTNNIEYATEYQYFTFSVEATDPLTIYMSEIEVFYKGESCGFASITVTHAGGAEIVSINNHNHGQICDGCGMVCNDEEHDVPFWVPNGNASLVTCETESGTCDVCGEKVSRYIEDTATYETIFADSEILLTILSYVSMIVQAFALI